MRSLERRKQDVYFAKMEEEQDGLDTVLRYGPLIRKRLVVSVTSGTPEEMAAGLVPDYDRYITYHKSKYAEPWTPEEGMAVWVDVTPELEDDGTLVLDNERIMPMTPPDYVLKRILDTRQGKVARYGIKSISK